jgi:large repetitive protein
MTTKLPIDPNNLPVNTGNLYPPVILTGLTNDTDYTVTITAHLLDGTTITESRTVRPHADPAPNPPVTSTMNGLGLTGTGIPGYTVKLYDSHGVLVAEVTVDSTGHWSIPTSMFPNGTTVGFSGSLTITDTNGNESSPTMINSIDSIPPTAPTNINANGAGLSGTAEPGATVYLLDANGNVITSVLVDSTGHWFIPASSFPNGVISPFTGSIKVVDPAGNESTIVNLNISNIDTSAPFAPIPATQNATGLSGIAEPGTTINLLDSNGNIVASVLVDNTGFWTIPASSFPNGSSNGFSGSIVSVDAAGNISAPTAIHSIDGNAPNPPVITIANASKLAGTAEANTTIKLYNSSSALVTTVTTDPLGNWIITPDKFPGGATNGFTGTITASDIALNESTATPVPTIDGLAPNPPVITIANATGLFGTSEPNAVIRMYNSFGILVAGTIADSSGNWSFPYNNFPANATNGFSGYLTQTDTAGNVSTQTTITPIDGIPPIAPVYTVANHYGISGTAEPGSRISLKDNSKQFISITIN